MVKNAIVDLFFSVAKLSNGKTALVRWTTLNRLLTWTDQGIELEAGPRHVEILLREVGCEGSKVTARFVKERVEEALASEDLAEAMNGMYRSATALRIAQIC